MTLAKLAHINSLALTKEDIVVMQIASLGIQNPRKFLYQSGYRDEQEINRLIERSKL